MSASIFIDDLLDNEDFEQFDSSSTLILKADPARARLLELAKLTSLPFFIVDVDTFEILEHTEIMPLQMIPEKIKRHLKRVNSVWVVEQTTGLIYYAVPMPKMGERRVVAMGCALSRADARSNDITISAAQMNWSQKQLNDWYCSQTPINAPWVEKLLKLAYDRVETNSQTELLSNEIDELGCQVDQTLAEINLLHTLTGSLQLSRSTEELVELCLERIPALINSDGCAIRIDDSYGEAMYMSTDHMPLERSEVSGLIARFEEQIGTRPFVKNELAGTLRGVDFPKLSSLVLVPITEGTRRIGWIMDCNIQRDEGYRTVEVSLLSSVASILGTHRCNLDLYVQNEELLISFVHSLVSTLDAKDPYTRGHSERVARFARRIGQQMHLPLDDLQDIYLAGLLHDIGKVGVDDRILRKKE